MRCVHNWVHDKARGARFYCTKVSPATGERCNAFGHRKKWNQGKVHRYRCAHSGCGAPATHRSWSGLYERWWCVEHAPASATLPLVS